MNKVLQNIANLLNGDVLVAHHRDGKRYDFMTNGCVKYMFLGKMYARCHAFFIEQCVLL